MTNRSFKQINPSLLSSNNKKLKNRLSKGSNCLAFLKILIIVLFSILESISKKFKNLLIKFIGYLY